jgi:hypothetical protein
VGTNEPETTNNDSPDKDVVMTEEEQPVEESELAALPVIIAGVKPFP